MSLRTASLHASLLLFAIGSMTAATDTMSYASPAPAAMLAQAPNSVSSRLLHRRVRRDLASRLNVPAQTLQIVETTPEIWPDQCLGLARPYERCQTGEVNGWQVVVASPQQMWIYRSDRTGQRLKLEPLPGAPDFGTGDFSAVASQRLLQTVAEQVGVSQSRLQVLEVQSATWDGCLGVYVPDYACTMIALAGFRVLVSDGDKIWVYHLSENGEQIAQNTTASGASASLSVSFMPIEPPLEALDDQIVFQSQMSGDLTGSVQRVMLMADGKLYREQSEPLAGSALTRTLIKTLSAEEVEAFRDQLIQQHRFVNFHLLRYLSEAAFADYPTIRLQTPYQSVEYIDLEIEQLPADLRDVIALWNKLQQRD
ncbi:MAG: hypothetical protein HC800_21690 [Phormidesmis sp. RL_2_1]|nr:hypothetical protein [Phormidesmis sp. RL_2_1]